ncbi:MAG TPA: type I-B CRISPR-associated protein Cas8b/Csh1, partial [Methanomicrobia archaeon]|nr:type I-B CRISPR-associated protein Cas8b/Csh1 [Methanomicrobia archaeon]
TDVSPARLSKIIREADRVMEEFGENYNPTLRNLYEIFKPPKSRGAGKKQFYELVKSMYEDKEFSKETFLFYSMRWARNNISSSDSNTLVPRMIRTGRMLFSFYVYLARINVFKGGKYMKNGGFFERYSEFFDKEWKKAVFLTGVLAGYLIGYQSEERGSVPFVKKLKGLKMRKEDVEGLLPEIKAKTLQYKIEDEKLEKIFSSVSQYFLKAGSWQASVDEINFVFTVGMSMYTKFFQEG